MQNLSYKTLFLIIVFLLIPIVLLLRIQQKPKSVLAEWWNDSWTYRQAITITIPSSTGDFTNLDTNISIGTSALISSNKLQSNCADLRFTDVSGNLLPYFIDSGCNTSTTKIWVRANLVPKNTTTYTMYVYYGNPSATATSDSTTFNLYNGLVGYWNFNENTGTTAFDLSTYSNHIPVSGPSWTTGQYNTSLSFSGTNSAPFSNLTLDTSTQNKKTTVSFWMYWTGSSGQMPFSWNSTYYDLYLNTGSNCFGFNSGYSDCWGRSIPGNLANQWHHIVATFNNGDIQQNTLSIDGTLQTLSQVMGVGRTEYVATSGRISGWDSSGEYFGGKIDDVRIYNRALSSVEVSKLYNTPGSIVNSTSTISKPTVSFATEETGGGPIAWWKFDEGVGTSAFDSSGHSHSAGVTNGSWQTEDQCISGKCLKFNGTSGGITGGTAPSLNMTDQFTTEMWVYWYSHKNYGSFFGKPVTGSANTTNFMWFGYDNSIRFFIGNGSSNNGATVNVSSGYINTNMWHHLVSRVTSSKVEIWVDGVMRGQTNRTVNPLPNANAINIISPSYTPNAKFDDLKLYNYARSDSQIKTDYASGLAGQAVAQGSSVNIGSNSQKSLSDGLVGYWKFDEGVGTTTADSSGNSNTATLAGATIPSWISGKYGIGLSFSGTAYITTGQTVPSTISVSAWATYSADGMMWNRVSGVGPDLWFYSGNIYLNTWDGTANPLCVIPSDANNGQFHHYVLINSSPRASLYYDGRLCGTALYKNPAGAFIISSGESSYGWKGKIDEVRVYNRALSADDVKKLYNYSPGPIGYWKFDEGVGTSAFDSSGNNRHGVLLNSPSWGIGKYSTGISIFNTNQSVQLATNPLAGLTAFTVSTWAYRSGNNDDGIIGTAGGGPYWRSVGGGGMFYIHLRSSDCASVNNWQTNSAPLTGWHYYTLSIDSNGALKYYRDSILQASSDYLTIQGKAWDSVCSTSSQWRQLGNYNSTYGLNGTIDDFKIYNYARTQSQILEDMGASPASTSPILWYKFDEGQGTSTANWGIGGTLTGTLGSGSSSPTWTTGKNNKGLSFDGSNDYVTGPTESNFDFTSQFSVATWVNVNNTDTNYTKGIVCKETGASADGFCLGNYNSKWTWWVSGSSLQPSTNFNLNQWYHLVGTYSNGTSTLYVNGQNIGSTTANLVNNNDDLIIGRWIRDSDYRRFLNGLIDDVKIFNYALSSDEIKKEYNQGAALVVGASTQTIGATTTSLDYCIPGDTSPCSSPIAEWKFDEGVGTSAYDTSGNNNHGVFGSGSSSPAWTTGKIGSALTFDGNNDYVNVGDITTFDGLTQMTISAWIYPNSLPSGGDINSIIAKADYNAASSNGYFIRLRGTEGIRAQFSDGTNLLNCDTSTLPTISTWTMVTAVLDNNDNCYIYFNGQQKTTASNVSFTTIKNNSNSLKFGSSNYSSELYFDGQIDQVRIYNYARTPAQIAYDYNKGGPVGWWKMDECQGTQIADWSGNSNHGTLTIGAAGTQTSAGTCTTASTAWGVGATGKINSSLNFDGTDDLVDNGNNFNMSTNDFSLTTWIKPSGTGYRAIISKGDAGIGANKGYRLRQESNDKLLFTVTGNSEVGLTTPNTLTSGNWYHVVATKNSSTMKIYVNGSEWASTSSPSGTIDNSVNAYIGRQSSWYWNGLIDDVRIYNYALTATQIKTLYNGGAINFR